LIHFKLSIQRNLYANLQRSLTLAMEHTLTDRYKQYKAGTTKLVSWLVNTAQSCREITTIIPLPGKAKQRSKIAKRARTQTENATGTGKVTVTSSQLLSLAKVITQASVKIPQDIIKTTKAVIAGLQLCAEWYASAGGGGLKMQKDQGHRHFINVLKYIQRLLETPPARDSNSNPSEKPGHNPPKKQPANDDTPANMFSYLQVDEPVENPLGSAPAKQPQKPEVEYELQCDESDEIFAAWCLLQDLYDLRQEVKSVWLEYKARKIAFSSAAEITVAAISMASVEENDLVDQQPQLKAPKATAVYFALPREMQKFVPRCMTFILRRERGDKTVSKQALRDAASMVTEAGLCMDNGQNKGLERNPTCFLRKMMLMQYWGGLMRLLSSL
jgi:hypothetical protein